MRADKLVLATNGYTDDLWPKLRRTIVPVYSGIVATEPIPEDIARAIFPDALVALRTGQGDRLLSARLFNRVLMGGRCRQRDVATSRADALSHPLHASAVAAAAALQVHARLERAARGDDGSLSPHPRAGRGRPRAVSATTGAAWR